MTITCDEVYQYCKDCLVLSRWDLSQTRSFERIAELCALSEIEVDMTSVTALDPLSSTLLTFTDVTAMFHGVAAYLKRLSPPRLYMASVIKRAIATMELALDGDDLSSKMREITV